MNVLSKVKNTASTGTVKNVAADSLQSILNVLGMDPTTVIELIKKMKDFPSTVRDGIFFECMEAYILNLNNYDNKKKMFAENNLHMLAIALAESSPDQESGYKGDVGRLHEYSKRIVKLIDDCGTIQKAVYLANISRALAKQEIDKRVFFKLGQCIRMLTEEDLLFLREDIREKKISGDADYIDDYRGLGLMYEVDGGFCYTKKAFQLLKYALGYERDIRIPKKFPERNVMTATTEDDIKKCLRIRHLIFRQLCNFIKLWW